MGKQGDLAQALNWTAGIERGHRPEAGPVCMRLRWLHANRMDVRPVNQFPDWGCATAMMSLGKVSRPDGQNLISQDRSELFYLK